MTAETSKALATAQLCCQKLKQITNRALSFINESRSKDVIYAASGDDIIAAPETLIELEKALASLSVIHNTIENHEAKHLLGPEKFQELETALDSIRMKYTGKKK